MEIVVCGVREIPSPAGGIVRFVEQVYPRLVAKGHTVYVYCRGGGYEERTYRGLLIRQIPFHSSKYLCYFTYMARAYPRIVRNHDRSAIIHVNGPGVYGPWVPLLRRRGHRVVVHSHGFSWRGAKWPLWFKVLMRGFAFIGARAANAVISVSGEELDYFKRQAAWRRILHYHLPNGMPETDSGAMADILEKHRLSSGEYYLFVGRVVPEKRVLDLVHAYRQAASDKKLVVVGGGSYTDRYVSKVKRLAADTKGIILTGWLENEIVIQLHKNAHAFILPSETEGYPISLMEAVSCGTISIVSDIRSLREIGGDRLIYFPVGDSAALASIIKKLDNSPEYCEQNRAKVGQLAKTLLSWDEVARRLEQMYKKVAQETGSDKAAAPSDHDKTLLG